MAARNCVSDPQAQLVPTEMGLTPPPSYMWLCKISLLQYRSPTTTFPMPSACCSEWCLCPPAGKEDFVPNITAC